MSNAVLLWLLFITLLVVHTLARRRAAGGEVPLNAVLLAALGATLIAAGVFAGVPQALVMGLSWVLVAAFGGAPERPAGQGRRAVRARVRRSARAKGRAAGGMRRTLTSTASAAARSPSTSTSRKGIDRAATARGSCMALAATAEIAAVLSRHKLSVRAFLALRERLVEVRDLEWEILSDPKNLDKLIRLVAARKTQSEIGAAFRALLARQSKAS